MSKYTNEIEKRRTFAIISHPDAGKTTLTEKFLLYGGAINLAGSVKGKATARHAVSDWMEIEKERGISVTSSVLQFHYDGYCINILDTPGHQDFSEDTYRTLMAADSAVMVIDGSKGVEAQTRKLFKVCVMRHIPIFTFINKMDRDANDTFDLLDEIEKELGIATCPINWPIGSGKKFRGVYDRDTEKILTFSDTQKGTKEGVIEEIPLSDSRADEIMDPEQKAQLLDEIELLDGASADFDQELVSKGKLTPVFFGSALTNFGVETFLEHFLKMTTSPLPRVSDIGEIDPMDDDFSAFVFKIQANMNKAHRDRIAFMRICSGKFDASQEVYHVQGDKKMRLLQPQQMMAESRHVVEEAYAGDIIGVFDDGEALSVLKSDVASGMKWYEVTRANGATGWIAADYCVVADEYNVPSGAVQNGRKGVITGTEVRMRGDASLNGDVLGYFEQGETVTILDAADGGGMNWLRVRRENGETGWVAAAYCKEA